METSPLPHVELLPLDERVSPDALSGFVAASRPWSRQPVALARRTTATLWAVTAIGASVCIGLLAVIRQPTACRGLPCSAATFGGHPVFTLAVAGAGTASLLTLGAFTHGLTRMGALHLSLAIPAAGVTVVSVAGAVVVLVVAVLLTAAVVVALLLFVSVLADRV
jgi:hypothetical protein